MLSVFQGTTGSPKGATLSHYNIVNNANLIGMRLGVSKSVSLLDGCISWGWVLLVPKWN